VFTAGFMKHAHVFDLDELAATETYDVSEGRIPSLLLHDFSCQCQKLANKNWQG
jgi:hypothetical protein